MWNEHEQPERIHDTTCSLLLLHHTTIYKCVSVINLSAPTRNIARFGNDNPEHRDDVLWNRHYCLFAEIGLELASSPRIFKFSVVR